MRYFLIILLVSLSLVWAEDPEIPQVPEVPEVPEAPQMDATAQAFLDKATAFAENYLTSTEKFTETEKAKFASEIAAIAADVVKSENFDPSRSFDPNNYVDGVTTKVGSILNSSDFKDSKYSDIRKDYLDQIANFCMKEYLTDMKNGISTVTTSDYLNDVQAVGTNHQQEIDYRKNPPTGTAIYQNPKDYLDTVYGNSPTVTILTYGVNNNVINSNLMQLLDRIQSKYYNTSTYTRSDFDELKKDIPQKDALRVMDGAANNNVYEKYGSVGTSYTIDQYGRIINEVRSTTSTAQEVFPPANDGTYNSRSYSVHMGNGTHKTFKLTMNGREYTMQETIFTSPIVLDLNGDGILEASNGQYLPHSYNDTPVVEFDMDGDNFLDLTEWVGENDGLLLVYKPGEDVTANNLFGTAGGFDDGYQKLSWLDKNKDGKLTGEELSTLSVWQDKNVDGIVDSGEISSVQKLGITSIGVNHKDYVSSFVQNGTTKKMWDWFPNIFRVKRTK